MFMRSTGGSRHNATGVERRFAAAREEHRRIAPADRLGAGSLACPSCDAPVSIGPAALTPASPLSCPFCARSGPLRDFLSLALPTRPARVTITVRI
jgi:hypothetical protein